MPSFTVHDKSTASRRAQETLDRVKQQFGFVPNLLGVMAEAPAATDAYLALSKLVGETSFTPAERHVAWFTVNTLHDCRYCMAAHTAIAQMEKVPAEVIEAARDGEPYADPRLEALRTFTRDMVVERGAVAPERVDAFLVAGFTRANVLEIITIIAHKVMSNYTNHVANTPLDKAFQPHEWNGPEAKAMAAFACEAGECT